MNADPMACVRVLMGVLSVACGCAASLGGLTAAPREIRAPDQRVVDNESTKLTGFDFVDPAVVEATKLLEEGERDEAVEVLERQLKDNANLDTDRREKIRLGLGYVHARLGEFGKATNYLTSVGTVDPTSVVSRQAQVLRETIRLCPRLKPKRDDFVQKKDNEVDDDDGVDAKIPTRFALQDSAEWHGLLVKVRREMEDQMKKAHSDLERMIDQDSCGSIKDVLLRARTPVERIRVVYTGEPNHVFDDLMRRHGEALLKHIQHINERNASKRIKARELLEEIRMKNGKTDRVSQYKQLRKDVVQAIANGPQLEMEYDDQHRRGAGDMPGRKLDIDRTGPLVGFPEDWQDAGNNNFQPQPKRPKKHGK